MQQVSKYEPVKEWLVTRRIGLLLMVGALFLLLVSGVALAKSFQCTDPNCFGTNNNDQIRERQGDRKQDDIHARGGNDRVNAGRFNNDTDVLRGQKGNDLLISTDGDGQDFLICGSGKRDEVRMDAGDTVSDGCEMGVPADVAPVPEPVVIGEANSLVGP